jgi:hypothetical protein
MEEGMNRSFFNFLFLVVGLVSSQLILSACAGPQEIPESERKTTEGVLVQGGTNGFRMRDDSGNIIRFAAGNDVEYQPLDFHAYFGDRVRVTYYTAIKSGKELHKATKVVLLATSPDRLNLSGYVDGIIRASGVMRYLVYLPEHDLTVAFYTKSGIKKFPKNWLPKAGQNVGLYFSEDSSRFVKRFNCYQISRYGEYPVSIPEKTETGVVTEIFVHRSVKRAPDRFAFQLKNGDIWTMYGGGQTKLIPDDLKVQNGWSYEVQYYRLLMGDQSLRYVATRILSR